MWASLLNGGLFVLIILMFIGASPGSTGGAMKTYNPFSYYENIIASL